MFTISVFRGRHGGVCAQLKLTSEPEPYKVSTLVRSFVSDEWEEEDLAITEVCQRYRAWLGARGTVQ